MLQAQSKVSKRQLDVLSDWMERMCEEAVDPINRALYWPTSKGKRVDMPALSALVRRRAEQRVRDALCELNTVRSIMERIDDDRQIISAFTGIGRNPAATIAPPIGRGFSCALAQLVVAKSVLIATSTGAERHSSGGQDGTAGTILLYIFPPFFPEFSSKRGRTVLF